MRNQEIPKTSPDVPKIASPVLSIKVYYSKGKTLRIDNRTFYEAMNFIWNSPDLSQHEPLKIVFMSTGKTLYADKRAFHDYLEGKFNQQALINFTQCDELYRNIGDFTTENKSVIEAGFLWKANKMELTLIDDDNHVTTKLDKLLFEIAE